MTVAVTVFTSAAAGLLVPFNSAWAANAAQVDLDAGANPAAQVGLLQYATPAASAGVVSLPAAPSLGGVANRVNSAMNYGVLDAAYRVLVNQGSGQVVAVGSTHDTTVVSGTSGSVLFANQAPASKIFLGGGNNVLSNTNAQAGMTVVADGPLGGGLGGNTLLLENRAGGTMSVAAGAGLLIQLFAGGGEAIVAQSGTVVVIGGYFGTGQTGVATISAASAGTNLWVGVALDRMFITPGAADAFVFEAAFQEQGATLFGGTRVFAGQTISAPAYTGRTTVLGATGYLESGSAGGSIMSSGTSQAATTLVAGGAGDILFLNGVDDTALLGDQPGVIMTAGNITLGGGVKVTAGAGSGQLYGALDGYNDFTFTGAGAYPGAGFHDTSVFGQLPGSTYRDAATAAGGAGAITITDFLPRQSAGGAVFDRFDPGAATIATLVSTPLGGGSFNNVATLSDGTIVTFRQTFGAVHVAGTLIV